MHRSRIRDLALVAIAGGLLAFEAASLRAALPAAAQALAAQGVVGEARAASMSAALAVSSVLAEASLAASHAAVGAVKGAARRLGTVTPPRPAIGATQMAGRTYPRSPQMRVVVMAVARIAGRVGHVACSSCRRPHDARPAVQVVPGQSTL